LCAATAGAAAPSIHIDPAALENAVQWLLSQPSIEPEAPLDVHYARARQFYNVGCAAQANDLSFDAHLVLGAALSICERIGHLSSDDSDGNRFDELTVKIGAKLGPLCAQHGKWNGAERAFRATVAAGERLLAREPANDELQSALAAAWAGIGDLCCSRRRPADGKKAYERAAPLLVALADHRPEALECHTMLAATTGARSQLADTPQEAESLLRQSIDRLQSLAARFPDEERPTLLLLQQSRDLFGLLFDAERYAEAVSCASTGVARACEAEAQFPTPSMRAEYQLALRGGLLIYALCPVEEFRDPERALAVARALAEPKSASAFGHTAMAVAYNAAGDWQAAIEAAKLANRKQNDPANLFCLAVAYQRTGQPNLARQAYESAVDLLAQADDEVVSKIYQLQRREAERVLRIEV
jgi:tetratricopeptide (TPR) repeat protein